jgi:hypothetical protein
LRLLACAALAACAASPRGPAWTAARRVLPPKLSLVGEIDLTALRNTRSFDELLRWVREDTDLGESMPFLKSTCDIDLAYDVADVVFAEDDASNRAIFVAFEDTDEDAIEECMARIYAFLGHELGVKHDGRLTVYTLGDEHFAAAWLTPRVLAMDPSWSEDSLRQMIGGPGTTQPVIPGGVGWYVDEAGAHRIDARDVLELAKRFY